MAELILITGCVGQRAVFEVGSAHGSIKRDSSPCDFSSLLCIALRTALSSHHEGPGKCHLKWWKGGPVFRTNSRRVYFLINIPLMALWLLYIPPGVTTTTSTFCPHSVFMCFVWIWEQTVVTICTTRFNTKILRPVLFGCQNKQHYFSVQRERGREVRIMVARGSCYTGVRGEGWS
jgi:hypothetical protein